jgi:hypothetical protein
MERVEETVARPAMTCGTQINEKEMNEQEW